MTSLTRTRETRLFSGVCDALGRYTAVDPNWVRLAFVLLALASGLGTALYIILALLIPLEEDAGLPAGEVLKNNLRDMSQVVEMVFEQIYEGTGQNRFIALGLILLGAVLLFSQFGWLGYGWVLAACLILLGAYMLYRRGNS